MGGTPSGADSSRLACRRVGASSGRPGTAWALGRTQPPEPSLLAPSRCTDGEGVPGRLVGLRGMAWGVPGQGRGLASEGGWTTAFPADCLQGLGGPGRDPAKCCWGWGSLLAATQVLPVLAVSGLVVTPAWSQGHGLQVGPLGTDAGSGWSSHLPSYPQQPCIMQGEGWTPEATPRALCWKGSGQCGLGRRS